MPDIAAQGSDRENLRFRPWNRTRIVGLLGTLALPVGLFVVAVLRSAPIASLVTGLISTALFLWFYSKEFRPLMVGDTELRLPTGLWSRRVIAAGAISEVGLLYRSMGLHEGTGWVLEICDSEGSWTEIDEFVWLTTPRRMQGLTSQDLQRKLPKTRPGQLAQSIYEWAHRCQGPSGLLVTRDFISARQWNRKGDESHQGWWSPDGQCFLLDRR
jgi:hypothetical protein